MALLHFLGSGKEIKNELYDNQDQAFLIDLVQIPRSFMSITCR